MSRLASIWLAIALMSRPAWNDRSRPALTVEPIWVMSLPVRLGLSIWLLVTCAEALGAFVGLAAEAREQAVRTHELLEFGEHRVGFDQVFAGVGRGYGGRQALHPGDRLGGCQLTWADACRARNFRDASNACCAGDTYCVSGGCDACDAFDTCDLVDGCRDGLRGPSPFILRA